MLFYIRPVRMMHARVYQIHLFTRNNPFQKKKKNHITIRESLCTYDMHVIRLKESALTICCRP